MFIPNIFYVLSFSLFVALRLDLHLVAITTVLNVIAACPRTITRTRLRVGVHNLMKRGLCTPSRLRPIFLSLMRTAVPYMSEQLVSYILVKVHC